MALQIQRAGMSGSVTQATPAAARYITAPANAYWKVIGFDFIVVTTATVGNRLFELVCMTPSPNLFIYHRIKSIQAVGASKTMYMNPGVSSNYTITATKVGQHIPYVNPIWLPPSHVIGPDEAAGIDVADTFSLAILYEEFSL